MDVDLTAISSNAVAYFDKEQGFTAIRFSELGLQRLNGKPNQSVGKDATLTFNFNGNAVGTYKIGEDKTSLGIFLFSQMKVFGCGDTQSETEKYPCAGTVKITEVGPKFIKGTVTATIYTSPPLSKHIFRGNFYGKFKVNRAN